MSTDLSTDILKLLKQETVLLDLIDYIADNCPPDTFPNDGNLAPYIDLFIEMLVDEKEKVQDLIRIRSRTYVDDAPGYIR